MARMASPPILIPLHQALHRSRKEIHHQLGYNIVPLRELQIQHQNATPDQRGAQYKYPKEGPLFQYASTHVTSAMSTLTQPTCVDNNSESKLTSTLEFGLLEKVS